MITPIRDPLPDFRSLFRTFVNGMYVAEVPHAHTQIRITEQGRERGDVI